LGQYTCEQTQPRPATINTNIDMNQQPKTEKKPKTKSKAQIRDLKPKKDAKGGGLEGYLGTGGVKQGGPKPP